MKRRRNITAFVAIIVFISFLSYGFEVFHLTQKNFLELGKMNTYKSSLESAIGSSRLGFSVAFQESISPLIVNEPSNAFHPIRGIGSYLNWLRLFGENTHVLYPLTHEEINTAYLDKIPLIFNNESLLNQTHHLTACNAILVMEKVGRLGELNMSLIASHIKTFQLEDGGFHSSLTHPPNLGNYSDLEATLQALQALEMAQEEPLNKTAVRDYIYSLQDLTNPLPDLRYDFKMFHGTVYWDEWPPSTHYTVLAALALRTLGFDLPHRSEIEAKINGIIDDFCSQFNTYSDEDKALLLFAFMKYSYIFNESEGKTIRDRLTPFTSALHESLPPNSMLLKDDFTSAAAKLGKLLTTANMANPNLMFTIVPGGFNGSLVQQNLTLRIENYQQVVYNLSNIEIVVFGEGTSDYMVHLSGTPNVTLADGDSCEYSIILQNLTGKHADSVDLKLSFSMPMKNVVTRENSHYDANIYFNLTNTVVPKPTPSPTESKTNISSGGGKVLHLVSLLPLIGLKGRKKKKQGNR